MTLCRLCKSNTNLITLFQDNEETKYCIDRILLTTGVHIRKDDLVSRMVCQTCCNFVEKMYKFRVNAVSNDKLLKKRLGQLYVPPVTSLEELRRIGEKILLHPTVESTNISTIDSSTVSNANKTCPAISKHDSVKTLIKKYPGIKFPEDINGCDINPHVGLNENDVKNWNRQYFARIQQRLSCSNITIHKVSSVNSSKTEQRNIERPATDLSVAKEYKEISITPITSPRALIPEANAQTASPETDISKTQINHVSTTTQEPTPRKRPLNGFKAKEGSPQKKKQQSGLSKVEATPTSGTQPCIEIFACQICARLYDTNKQLLAHQKRHLSCKYCGLKIPSVKRLQLHEKQGCHKNIMANPPNLKLHKVDGIKAITDKYASAFRSSVDTGSAMETATSAIIPKIEPDLTPINVLQSPVPVPDAPRKPPPPYPVLEVDKIVSNIQIQSGLPTPAVPERKPTLQEACPFTDDEILEMLNPATLAEYFPNTEFQHAIGPQPTHQNKETVFSAFKQPSSTCYNHPLQWTPNTNQTLQPNHNVLQKLQNYTNSYQINFGGSESYQQPAIAPNPVGDEWLQSDMTQESIASLIRASNNTTNELTAEFLANEMRRLSNASATEPIYGQLQYPRTPYDQANYNALSYHYEGVPNISHYTGINPNMPYSDIRQTGGNTTIHNQYITPRSSPSQPQQTPNASPYGNSNPNQVPQPNSNGYHSSPHLRQLLSNSKCLDIAQPPSRFKQPSPVSQLPQINQCPSKSTLTSQQHLSRVPTPSSPNFPYAFPGLTQSPSRLNSMSRNEYIKCTNVQIPHVSNMHYPSKPSEMFEATQQNPYPAYSMPSLSPLINHGTIDGNSRLTPNSSQWSSSNLTLPNNSIDHQTGYLRVKQLRDLC